MKKKLPADILEKYFKGDCNVHEIEEISSWYNSFEHDDDDLSDLSAEEKELLQMLMLNNIRENIRETEQSNIVDMKKGASGHPLFYFITGVAATLLIVFFLEHKKTVVQQVYNKEELVSNNTGAIEKIILSDGSKVWLSPRSQLSYLQLLGQRKREVSMTGEAFFEVTKNPARPFLIHSGNVTTKVWGTSFRIRAFKNDVTRVDVVTGKVSVSVPAIVKVGDSTNQALTGSQLKEVMLLPNQEAAYDKRTNDLEKKQKISDPSIIIWKKINISFDNTPMPDVFTILNKKFKVHITSGDKEINADFLNADFTDESLPAIMEMMTKTLDVNYTVNGSDYVLISNK